ncbi:MAG: hypothetical protein IKK73_00230 [Akkermansia sp.]|nr:hypothetical protein [Akkermansia sp.]
MSPQECGVLIDTTDFSGLANREAMQEAGNKLFPYGEFLLRVVENSISRNGESFVAMGAIETRTTIFLISAFPHTLTLSRAMRADNTISKFRINNKL